MPETKRCEFRVTSFHPPEYKGTFYSMFEKEKTQGNLTYKVRIEETAPPPELIKDIVLVSAASLSILKTLYDFYKEIKGKKGKVFITINGKQLDLEALNIDELKAVISRKEEE